MYTIAEKGFVSGSLEPMIVFLILMLSLCFIGIWSSKNSASFLVSLLFFPVLLVGVWFITALSFQLGDLAGILWLLGFYIFSLVYDFCWSSYRGWDWFLKDLKSVTIKGVFREFFWRIKSFKLFPYELWKTPYRGIVDASVNSDGSLSISQPMHPCKKRLCGRFFTEGNMLRFINRYSENTLDTVFVREKSKDGRIIMINRYHEL